MKRITKIFITKVEITGFKGYKEKTIFEFDELNEIFGENGKGKSSLMDAITWCFFSTSPFGDIQVDDIYMNKESISSRVDVHFRDQDEEMHMISRRKKKLKHYILIWSQYHRKKFL